MSATAAPTIFRDGELVRLTHDHSLVEELIRRGKLTPEQAAAHPQRSIITRALGIEPEVEVDTWSYPMRAGDVVLLCSDGLTSMISEPQIAAVLAEQPDLERAGDRLIAEANEAGGRDNITVVLFRLEDVDAESSQAAADRAVDGRSTCSRSALSMTSTVRLASRPVGTATRSRACTRRRRPGWRCRRRRRRSPV